VIEVTPQIFLTTTKIQYPVGKLNAFLVKREYNVARTVFIQSTVDRITHVKAV
jgi:hypothetical protein